MIRPGAIGFFGLLLCATPVTAQRCNYPANLLPGCGFESAQQVSQWRLVMFIVGGYNPVGGIAQSGAITAETNGSGNEFWQIRSACVTSEPDTEYGLGAFLRLDTQNVNVQCSAGLVRYDDDQCAGSAISSNTRPLDLVHDTFIAVSGAIGTFEATGSVEVVLTCSADSQFTATVDEAFLHRELISVDGFEDNIMGAGQSFAPMIVR